MIEKTRKASVDYAILSCWIALSVLCFALLFLGTGTARSASLSRSVDTAFAEAKDARKLDAALPARGGDGIKELRGKRFSLKGDKGIAVVFTVAAEVSAGTYVAVIGPKGELSSVLPLSSSKAGARVIPALAWIQAQGIAAAEQRK